MGIHLSPCAFMSVDKDRYLYNPDSFYFEGVSSHIEKSLTLFSGAQHLMFAVHMINIYETRSGSFVTSLIFVKIKIHERMPFCENLVLWHSHQPVYANVFRKVVRDFFRWSTLRHALLDQEDSQIQNSQLYTRHRITKFISGKSASYLEQLNPHSIYNVD